MPYQPFLPFVSFFVAVGLVPAVYFLFEDESYNNHVSKIAKSESKVPGANVTYQSEDEDDFLDVDGVDAAEDRDVLVTVIEAFCQVCHSGEKILFSIFLWSDFKFGFSFYFRY